MPNPILDRERVEFLKARTSSSGAKAQLAAWPRAQKELPLVDLEVKWVRFSTLNHRTKAEQQRHVHRIDNKSLFKSDPLGPAAQAAQFEILKSQSGFLDLKEDLKNRRQQEPGVVTAEGVLINGNRRAAALRSLFIDDAHMDARYVRCLVLPEDATIDEVLDLETELQIARDFKEDYSWINEALLIEELYAREGRDYDRVAKKLYRDANYVRSTHEKIQHVNQLVALSGGNHLHIDFEEHQSAFDELSKHIRNKPREEAESVRSAYFLGTLAGVNYRDLRNLRRPEASKLIRAEIERDPALASILTKTTQGRAGASQSDDLLDDVLGSNNEDELSGVLSLLASKERSDVIELSAGEEASVQDIFNSLKGKIEAAARDAREDRRDQETLEAPIVRINNAIGEVERAIAALPRARALPDWVEPRFEERLQILKAAIQALEQTH
ncbi:TPA: hypothetical protein QDC55_005963 [Burkholderia cenocepacia]|nr:hypothetical protein [Burkholderia cenocepacia]HDR9814945.1 hypothetical protein [Burkholderia cenocepacia]HDR9817246.1 hypothetical protein [Burkholderia cenocepacia]HDR9832355.1 hypothetical protein [Burkholderia cenocepacia]